MCKAIMTQADIIQGDGLFFKFCKEFEVLYGQKAITPKHAHPLSLEGKSIRLRSHT